MRSAICCSLCASPASSCGRGSLRPPAALHRHSECAADRAAAAPGSAPHTHPRARRRPRCKRRRRSCARPWRPRSGGSASRPRRPSGAPRSCRPSWMRRGGPRRRPGRPPGLQRRCARAACSSSRPHQVSSGPPCTQPAGVEAAHAALSCFADGHCCEASTCKRGARVRKHRTPARAPCDNLLGTAQALHARCVAGRRGGRGGARRAGAQQQRALGRRCGAPCRPPVIAACGNASLQVLCVLSTC